MKLKHIALCSFPMACLGLLLWGLRFAGVDTPPGYMIDFLLDSSVLVLVVSITAKFKEMRTPGIFYSIIMIYNLFVSIFIGFEIDFRVFNLLKLDFLGDNYFLINLISLGIFRFIPSLLFLYFAVKAKELERFRKYLLFSLLFLCLLIGQRLLVSFFAYSSGVDGHFAYLFYKINDFITLALEFLHIVFLFLPFALKGDENSQDFDEDGLNSPMSVKEWLVTYIISSIPIVNIIMLFVWAFSEDIKINKKNWARATLLWFVIVLVLSSLITGCLFILYKMRYRW